MTICDPLNVFLSATHARVDLDQYERNIRILREIAGLDRDFMAVVKGNAYGHGAVACAGAALHAGATHLAVARVSEALELRAAGIDAPILLLGGPNLAAIDQAVDHRIALTVGTKEAMEAVQAAAQRTRERPVVHIKVDTGLHRYGADPELAVHLAQTLAADDRVSLEGLYAHFSSSDEADEEPTRRQIEVAEATLRNIATAGVEIKYIHLPNSAAIIKGRTGNSNLVRSGTATYGLAPAPDMTMPSGIRPIMTVHSTFTRVSTLPVGEGVSYGLTYRANAPEWLGTVPVGFADGLPRSLSNRGWFLVNGQRCPIRGRVCMDQTIIGLPAELACETEVTLIGNGEDDAMTVDTVADMDGTIHYEVASGLSARVPRIYYRGDNVVGWVDAVAGVSKYPHEG